MRALLHVLEKGLAHKHRRDVFGKEMVRRAVACYEGLREEMLTQGMTPKHGDEELCCWAEAVLHHYFAVCGQDPEVEALKRTFLAQAPERQFGKAPVPYVRETTPLRCSYAALLELAKRRRSVRWYLPRAVPRQVIDRAVEIASLSPSGCCQQPFQFRFFDDPAMVQKLRALPGGITAFSETVPCVAVVIVDYRSITGQLTTRHSLYIDAAMAAMSLQLALEVQSVSSCCINWSHVPKKEAELAELISLGPYERAIMFLTIGYADPEAKVGFSQKRTLDELRRYN